MLTGGRRKRENKGDGMMVVEHFLSLFTAARDYQRLLKVIASSV
jgi:hypothetical protein